MGKKINRDGWFIGYAMESGVSKTKANSYPQFVAKFQAVQEYDFESSSFVDITDAEEVEAVGYFVLFGKDRAVLPGGKQVKAAYPDLAPLTTRKLNETDLSEIPVLFQVEEQEYKDKKSFKVIRLDHADATPGSGIIKSDDTTIDEIEAKYAAAFRELNGGDKPASVPAAKKVAEKKAAGKPVVPKITQPAETTVPDNATEEPTNKELMKDMAKTLIKQQKERAADAEYNAMSPTEKKAYNKKQRLGLKKPNKPKIPTVTKIAASLEEPGGVEAAISALDLSASCTQEQAWETCESNTDMPGEQLAEVWTEVIHGLGGDTDTIEANKAWPEVRTKVLERVIDVS